MSFGEIQNAVAKLPDTERAQLAAWILESLPDQYGEDSIADSLAEAERREAEMESGDTKALTENEFWLSVNSDRS